MILVLLIPILSLIESFSNGETNRTFIQALHHFHQSSALVVASQAVDERPVWSPDGRFLAVNVDESWSKVDLASISLIKGTWHDGVEIGVADPPPRLDPIPESEVRNWEKAAKAGPRHVETANGTSIELEEEGLGTVFRITSPGGRPRVLWKTSLENCHGLALSPNQSLVAFVCELNGVIVTALESQK